MIRACEVLPRLAEVGIVSRAVRCLEVGTEVAPPPSGPIPGLPSPSVSDTKGMFGWVFPDPAALVARKRVNIWRGGAGGWAA